MKTEKVFVRYKNLNEGAAYNAGQEREREPRGRGRYKKVYAEKTNRPREALRATLQAYDPLPDPPPHVAQLIAAYPKFFTAQPQPPEKDANEYLNEFVIFNAKKYVEALHHHPRRDPEPHPSSSDPDWNSDEEVDNNLESRKIEEALVQKVVEKYGDRLVKKQEILKRHEKEFLEDYFRQKRQQLQDDPHPPPLKEGREEKEEKTERERAEKVKNAEKVEDAEKVENAEKGGKGEKVKKNIWSEYQEKQINNFVDLGFMTKVDDDEIEAEIAEDDGMFASESDSQEEEEKKSSSSEEDDIFGDEGPTTIKVKEEEQAPKPAERPNSKGTVFINDQIFSKIAEEVGLFPSRCVWIISNSTNKFRVSTEYMDTIYRKEKISDLLPDISLNHSEFVTNEEVETPQALEVFRRFNARREKKHYPNHRYAKQYKEKPTHLKKK